MRRTDTLSDSNEVRLSAFIHAGEHHSAVYNYRVKLALSKQVWSPKINRKFQHNCYLSFNLLFKYSELYIMCIVAMFINL